DVAHFLISQQGHAVAVGADQLVLEIALVLWKFGDDTQYIRPGVLKRHHRREADMIRTDNQRPFANRVMMDVDEVLQRPGGKNPRWAAAGDETCAARAFAAACRQHDSRCPELG